MLGPGNTSSHCSGERYTLFAATVLDTAISPTVRWLDKEVSCNAATQHGVACSLLVTPYCAACLTCSRSRRVVVLQQSCD